MDHASKLICAFSLLEQDKLKAILETLSLWTSLRELGPFCQGLFHGTNLLH